MKVYVLALIYSFLFQNVKFVVGNFPTRHDVFVVEKNKKIRSVPLTSLGRMSRTQCAALCMTFSDRCCEIAYITSTQECKLDQSGCCHTDFDYLSDSNLIHIDRKHMSKYNLFFLTLQKMGIF